MIHALTAKPPGFVFLSPPKCGTRHPLSNVENMWFEILKNWFCLGRHEAPWLALPLQIGSTMEVFLLCRSQFCCKKGIGRQLIFKALMNISLPYLNFFVGLWRSHLRYFCSGVCNLIFFSFRSWKYERWVAQRAFVHLFFKEQIH